MRAQWPLIALTGAVVLTVNIDLGIALATDTLKIGAVVALLPVLVIAGAALIASNRAILVFGAFALDLSGVIALRRPIVGHFWASDVVLILALVSWLAAWLIAPGGHRPRLPNTPLLRWPLLVLAIFVGVGVVRGHERWGLGYLSQPVRFVLYAGIAFAIADLTVRQVWQALVAVFYLGAIANSIAAVYYLATGTVQEAAKPGVSTGGTRALALTTALYLTGSVVLALLNLEREQRIGRRSIHLLIGGLATFGIVVAYGRGVWFALTAVLIVLFLTRRRLRTAAVTMLPLLLPALIAGSVLLVNASPGFVPNLFTRLTTLRTNDPSIGWRQAANRAVWKQVREDPLLGVGFGKGATFVDNGSKFTITQDPHNSYLFLWAGGGAATLAAFLLVYLVFLVDAWRRQRHQGDLSRSLIVACVAIWFCFAADTLSSPQLTQANSLLALWTLMLLPSVVPYIRRDSRQSSSFRDRALRAPPGSPAADGTRQAIA